MKPKATQKNKSGMRLYAIARRRGGAMATGLYQDTWDRMKFLVQGYPKSRYKKVRDKDEGISFIKGYHRSKGWGRPPCLKQGRSLYPRISKIRRCLGLDRSNSKEYTSSSASYGDSDIFCPSFQPIIIQVIIQVEKDRCGSIAGQ